MTKGKTQKIHSFHKHNAHFDNNFTTVFNTQFDNKLCGSLQKNAGDDARSAQKPSKTSDNTPKIEDKYDYSFYTNNTQFSQTQRVDDKITQTGTLCIPSKKTSVARFARGFHKHYGYSNITRYQNHIHQ